MERPLSDKDYRSRWDAETLANAKEIEADPARLAGAQTAATRLADEDARKAKHMRQVARRKKTGGGRSPYAGAGKEQPDQTNHNVFKRI